mmetsp:Transcript_9652/g.27087  ORF Transcript_9652/g.27087 Transcript_9652/m.27087 type:complete len:218 (+) Transcript_9652:1197-1850(+)
MSASKMSAGLDRTSANCPSRMSSTWFVGSRSSTGTLGVRERLERERYQAAETNCRSSKPGSSPTRLLHRDGTSRTPSGSSCSTAMASRRPRKRHQVSVDVLRSLEPNSPGMGLSWKYPSSAGINRPSVGLQSCAPARAKNSRRKPPWSMPMPPSNFTLNLLGARDGGDAERICEKLDRRMSSPTVTVSVRAVFRLWPGTSSCSSAGPQSSRAARRTG